MNRPRRSYRAVIISLSKVWQIELVNDQDAIWQYGLAESPSFTNEIRVAIWNLCKGAGGYEFEHEYKLICRQSDLVLTQEALLSKRSIKTYSMQGFNLTHAASYRRSDGLRDGVMTVSRVAPIPSSLMRIICKYPEPLLKTPKAALVQAFPMAGTSTTLLVINIHATLMRWKSAAVEEMNHVLAKLPDHQGPILFAGDFNTFTPGYLNVVMAELSRLKLEYVPILDDPRPRSQALDQVFCRGLEIRRIRVDTNYRNSDHFPIFLDIRIK